MRKHGLKALGLALVAAIGLMALGAAVVQAASLSVGDEFYSGESGTFLINSGTKSPTGLTTQAIGGSQLGAGRLLIPGKAAEIVCSKGVVENGTIANEYENFKTPTMAAGGHGSASLTFKECKVQEITPGGDTLTGVELKSCTEELNGKTREIKASVLFLVKKHEGKIYLVIVPQVTSKSTTEANEKLTAAFTTIKFGELCALPESVKVTGSLVVEAPLSDSLSPSLNINSFGLSGKINQELLGAKLKFGANEAFIQSQITLELVGKITNWGAM